jgi:ubiquinone/menaquinone biosynthesis C-methylase UbiE
VSTEALLARALITATSRVLDVGCGVATTAIEIARRFSAQVTAVDIAPLMLERAEANVRATKMTGRVTVQPGDLCALPFDDDSFDVVTLRPSSCLSIAGAPPANWPGSAPTPPNVRC